MQTENDIDNDNDHLILEKPPTNYEYTGMITKFQIPHVVDVFLYLICSFIDN